MWYVIFVFHHPLGSATDLCFLYNWCCVDSASTPPIYAQFDKQMMCPIVFTSWGILSICFRYVFHFWCFVIVFSPRNILNFILQFTCGRDTFTSLEYTYTSILIACLNMSPALQPIASPPCCPIALPPHYSAAPLICYPASQLFCCFITPCPACCCLPAIFWLLCCCHHLHIPTGL